ncbi:MAG: hypothetical protein QM756_14320 [Polyangiaceae bacterium]
MNTFTLGRYIEAFLFPLNRALSSEVAEAQLLERLGFVLPPNVSFLGPLQGTLDVASGLTRTLSQESIDAAAAAMLTKDLIVGIRAVSEAVTELDSALSPSAASSPLATATDLLETLPRKLFDFLLVDFLDREAPAILGALRVLSIVRMLPVEVSGDPNRVSHVALAVAWEALPKLFSDPLGELKSYYGWGTPSGLDVPVLFESLRFLGAAVGLYSEYRAVADTSRALVDLALGAKGRVEQAEDTVALRVPLLPSRNVSVGVDVYPVANPAGVTAGLAFDAFVEAAAALSFPVTDNLRFDLDLGGHASGFGFLVMPEQPISVISSLSSQNPGGVLANIAVAADLAVVYEAPAGRALVLFGTEQATRFQVRSLSARVGGAKEQLAEDFDFRVEAAISEAALVIRSADGDGFLSKILPPDGVKLEFDFLLGYSLKSGVYFGIGAGIELALPVNLTLFDVITIDTVYLALRAKTSNGKAQITLAGSVLIKLAIGPLKASIDKIGVQAELKSAQPNGNLGPMNLGVAFKPPNGVGLVLKSGPVKGGGYLFIDADAGEYAGILELTFSAIAIKAIGLITTKLPDGRDGFSMLIIITVEFTPIQLGYGFTLNGVGGLIGIHRDMLLEPLRDGIKHHTVDSVLFPKDPVANAARIISDLKAIFPPSEGRFAFGLMAKLGWGSQLLTAELGIIIVLLEPVRLAILGKIALELPQADEDAIVRLKLDVLGTLDFAKGEIGIDAILYDSRIAIFNLDGGMALRIRWGESPTFVMAIGGFHPRFPVPPGFPTLDRLSLSLATSDNPRIRLATYIAVTSNTVQLGAQLDFHVEFSLLGTWSVDAFLGFDALIYLSPFHFTVDLFGGAALKHNGSPFLSIDLLLSVSGPGQWVVHGHAEFSFFGKHRVQVDQTFGEPEPPAPLPIASPLAELKKVLEDPRSWAAQLPPGGEMLVSLREIEAESVVLVHPLGRLGFRERVVPLGVTIGRFGAADPGDERRLEIKSIALGTQTDVVAVQNVSTATTLREQFAPGQFFELSEDAKLGGPEFEALPAGFDGIGSNAITWGGAVGASFDYETVIIDAVQPASVRSPTLYSPRVEVAVAQAMAGAAGAARATGAASLLGPSQGIEVLEPSYRLGRKDDGASGSSAQRYASRVEASLVLAEHPQAGAFQIVGSHEEAA